jgi:hypothetical protein
LHCASPFWSSTTYQHRRAEARLYNLFVLAISIFGAVLFGMAMSAQTDSANARDRFIGVWKLISCESKAEDGVITYPYGEKPVGRITYDKSHRMSAQLMRPGRKDTNDSGFVAYFGTFDVDESNTAVIHHVEASSRPSFVAIDLRRSYHFAGNRLTLTAANGRSTLRLVWERIPD